jgi:hypothetical protein
VAGDLVVIGDGGGAATDGAGLATAVSDVGWCRFLNALRRHEGVGPAPLPHDRRPLDELLQIGLRLMLAAAFAPDEQRD